MTEVRDETRCSMVLDAYSEGIASPWCPNWRSSLSEEQITRYFQLISVLNLDKLN